MCTEVSALPSPDPVVEVMPEFIMVYYSRAKADYPESTSSKPIVTNSEKPMSSPTVKIRDQAGACISVEQISAEDKKAIGGGVGATPQI